MPLAAGLHLLWSSLSVSTTRHYLKPYNILKHLHVKFMQQLGKIDLPVFIHTLQVIYTCVYTYTHMEYSILENTTKPQQKLLYF